MNPVRILVVDDAVVARRVISDILAAEDDFEVVGTAPNGNLALTKIARLHPDVVTLDIDMPELDGMQTLTAIRSSYPEIRVIMVSNHTRRGAAITVEALFSGASDYVTKAARSFFRRGSAAVSSGTARSQDPCSRAGRQLRRLSGPPKSRSPDLATEDPRHRGRGDRLLHRWPQRIDGDSRVAAQRLSCTGADCPAPARELHDLSRQTPRYGICSARGRGDPPDPGRARKRLDRARKPPPRDQVDDARNRACHHRRPVGQLLQTRGGRPLPIGGKVLRIVCARRRADRNGTGRARRLP